MINITKGLRPEEIKMTDENQSSANEGDQKVDVAKLNKDLADMAARIEAMDKKNQELLDEKKKKAEEARIASEELEKEKARKEGDIDKLLQIEKQKTEQAETKYAGLLNQIKTERIKSLAAALANEMRGRPESIKILTKCVVEEISDLVDNEGNLSDVKRALVIQNFKDSAEYKPLLMGNQSTGGSAEGSSGENSTKDVWELSEAEQRELYNKDPSKVKQLVASRKKQ
jgi:hypothetical protein